MESKRVVTNVITGALVLLLLASMSRYPAIAVKAWRRQNGFPDIQTLRKEVAVAWSPTRELALALLARAEKGQGLATMDAPEDPSLRDVWVQRRLAVQAWSVAASYVLYLPLGLVVALMAGFGSSWLRSEEGDEEDLDLGTQEVRVRTRMGPQGVQLPELELPRTPRLMSEEISGEAWEQLQHARHLAERHGPRSAELDRYSRTLGGSRRLVARLEELGRADAADAIPEAAMRAYEAAWDSMAGEQAATAEGRGAVARKALAGQGKSDMAALTKCFVAEVPPLLLKAREALRVRGLLTPLRERALRITAAHATYPASIAHHGTRRGGLAEHKADVLLRVIAEVQARKISELDRAAALDVAAIHDLGKILSYYQTPGGRWCARDQIHAQNTARILIGLQEFWREHTKDAERVVVAVRYDHNPQSMPLQIAEAARAIGALVSEEDQQSSIGGYDEAEALRRALSRVVDVLPSILREIPINRVPGASGEPRPRHVHGFYEPASGNDEELLVLSELQFRRKLSSTLRPLEQKILDLGSDRADGRIHPGFAHVAEKLIEEGLIPATVRGVPVQEKTGLVTVKSGSRFYKAMFPISLSHLRSRLGDELDKMTAFWRTGDRFGVSVVATGWDWTEEALTKLAEANDRKIKEDRDRASSGEDRCPACGKALKKDPSGKHLQCADYVAPRVRRCGVRFRLVDGAAVQTCECGKELVVIQKAVPRHMGCPDRCGKERKDAA